MQYEFQGNVQLILGPPGTGKTRALIDILKAGKELGHPISKVAYLSFTKAAIKEARDRIGASKEETRYFRTLHSLCFHLLKLRQTNLLTDILIKKFEYIMGDVGIQYVQQFNGDTLTTRNIPLYLHHMAKNRLTSIETVYNEGDFDVSLNDCLRVADYFEQFKKYHGAFDFNDILQKALVEYIEPVDVDLVVIDEAQDLTALQWSVVRRIFDKTTNVIIAGDDDQSIYQWAGADPYDIVSMQSATKKILGQSYRLPASIKRHADRLLTEIDKHNRLYKPYLPSAHHGKVSRAVGLEECTDTILQGIKANERTLMLARNLCFLSTFTEYLMCVGVPYTLHGVSAIDKREAAAITAWTKHINGHPLDEKDTRLIQCFTKDITTNGPWYHALTIDADKIDYYRRLLGNGFRLTDAPLVDVTTIHRSKGREAETVVIMPDQTRTTWKMSEQNNEQEARIFYVAVTRAKKNLFILEPETQYFYEAVLYVE
jgi:DNA helicase II / ATP-dependent DNA helicase PcrA